VARANRVLSLQGQAELVDVLLAHAVEKVQIG
jgi:hypothetical protein